LLLLLRCEDFVSRAAGDRLQLLLQLRLDDRLMIAERDYS
jgi:hypothetical protein